MKSSNLVFLSVASACAVAWYLMCGYAVTEILSSHPAAYFLAIYFSGFCEVGLEKYFFTRKLSGKQGFPKSLSFLSLCIIPCVLFSIVLLTSGRESKTMFAVLVISAGTTLYRLIFTVIENKLIKR